jgi:hypothetical protein
MKKILTYYSFIIVSLMVVVGFVSATTMMQLGAAVMFFPLFIFFAFQILPRKSRAISQNVAYELAPATSIDEVQKEYGDVVKLKKEGVDINRRQFLKLIGTAGLSLFLFSIFTKRAEGAFFGSVPGPGTVSIKNTSGVKIDPAVEHPTDSYRINEIDDSVISYLGFTNPDGAWFIMQEDTNTGTFRYIKGASNFATSWTNRAGLTYDYFNNVF